MKRNDSLRHGLPILFLNALFLLSPQLEFCQDEGTFDPLIEKYSKQYGVDKDLVKSLIQVSSGGNQKAVSQSGAIGLMQLTPATIKSLGVKNPYDAGENIRGGCSYLKTLLNEFGSTEMAVAAFDAGEGAVRKFGKVPPYAETKKFVDAVMKKYDELKEEAPESEVFGTWTGTGRYTKFISRPQQIGSIVGTTQPFDIQIDAEGSGIVVKTSKGRMGDPSLYRNVSIEKERLHVEYSGPNPWSIPIPNATVTNNMSYILDVSANKGVMKGEFSCTVTTKVVYHIPNLEMPEGNAEVSYTLVLNLKKK